MDVDPDREMDEEDEENSAWVSGSNLFADSGLPDAGELHVRSQLLRHLTRFFGDQKLSDLQVAEALGTSEHVAAALMGGQLEQFSIGQLFGFLDTLGYDAQITLTPRTPGKRISLRRKAKARR